MIIFLFEEKNSFEGKCSLFFSFLFLFCFVPDATQYVK